MMKMKKGIAPVIIGFIIIMLIVFGTIVALATNASRAGLTKKHLFEASLISESDKVETYARSFLRATDLSFIQSIHNVGNGEIIMPYDLDNSYYNKTYNLTFWQISSDSENDVLIPPKEILYNKFRQEISWTTSCYLKNYFDAYKNFASSDGFIFSGTPTPIAKVDILLSDSIRVLANDVSVHRTTIAEDREIEINKVFKPFSEISSKFGDTIDKAEELINNDYIGKCVRNETSICFHDMTKKDDTQNALNRLASSLSTSDIKYVFDVVNFKIFGSEGEAVVNVSIFDNITNYTVYSLNDNKVIIDYLGVEFLVLVYKTGDESWANSQHVLASDIARQCSSKINLINPRAVDDICQYFDVSPITCNDPGNNIYIKETCEDFTGSYEDVCVGSTLYQYKCHPSNICYYEKIDCLISCFNGACTCGPESCENLLSLVLKKSGNACGDPEYDPVADVNKDKIIDIFDIVEISINCGNGDWCQERLNDYSNPCVSPHCDCFLLDTSCEEVGLVSCEGCDLEGLCIGFDGGINKMCCQVSASTSTTTSTTTTTISSDCGPLSESECISRVDCSPCYSGTAYKDCCNSDEECVKIVGDAWCEVPHDCTDVGGFCINSLSQCNFLCSPLTGSCDMGTDECVSPNPCCCLCL